MKLLFTEALRIFKSQYKLAVVYSNSPKRLKNCSQWGLALDPQVFSRPIDQSNSLLSKEDMIQYLPPTLQQSPNKKIPKPRST